MKEINYKEMKFNPFNLIGGEWMLEIGLPLTICEIGATADMIPGITEGTICYPAGYMDLKPEDITEILKESM